MADKSDNDARLSRVLVVDDHHDHAEGIADFLRMHGFQVRTAANGELALSVVPEFGPSHIVMDIHMPSMDGNELAAMLRTYFGDEVVLIGMSGYPATDPSVSMAASMVDHYFQKPLRPEMLLAVLPSLQDRAGAACA